MSKSIEINYLGDSGYEVLYPKTLPELTGCLPLTGGTLTGPLTLNGEPSGEMEAVNKGYVDGQVGGVLKKVYEGSLSPTQQYQAKILFWENVSSARVLLFAIRGIVGTGTGTGQDFSVYDEANKEVINLQLGWSSIDAESNSFSVIFVKNGDAFSPSKSAARGNNGVYVGAPNSKFITYFNYFCYYATVFLVVWAIF